MYYTKNPKDSHPELMEEALGCSSKRTATEQKETFHNIITNAIGYDEEKSNNLFMEIQENINSRIDEHTTVNGKDSQPIILTNDTIQDILAESGVSEEDSSRIERFYTKEFGTTLPIADDLIDAKILKASEQKKKEQKLEKEVEILQNKLENTNKKLEEVSKMEDESEENYDIILKVKPEKASQIKSQIIEGQKYIVIPVEENEQTNVNGVDTKL